jgi:rhamnosyltransferase
MQSNKVCGVVVSFNASDCLLETVLAISLQVDILVVVDNASNVDVQCILDNIESKGLAKIIRLDDNYGIAFALNRGLDFAIAAGAEWVITFDQDSLPSENFIRNMLDFSRVKALQGLDISFLVPRISYFNHVSLPTARLEESFKVVDAAITSGTMVRTDLLKKIGPYDESYFIDSVDFDFCLRARLSGHKIYMLNTAILTHSLGTTKVVEIMKHKFSIYVHNPSRRYYMVRNHCYLQSRFFFSYPAFFLKKNLFMLLICLQVVFLENGKSEQFSMILKGLLDFFKGVKGKLA